MTMASEQVSTSQVLTETETTFCTLAEPHALGEFTVDAAGDPAAIDSIWTVYDVSTGVEAKLAEEGKLGNPAVTALMLQRLAVGGVLRVKGRTAPGMGSTTAPVRCTLTGYDPCISAGDGSSFIVGGDLYGASGGQYVQGITGAAGTGEVDVKAVTFGWTDPLTQDVLFNAGANATGEQHNFAIEAPDAADGDVDQEGGGIDLATGRTTGGDGTYATGKGGGPFKLWLGARSIAGALALAVTVNAAASTPTEIAAKATFQNEATYLESGAPQSDSGNGFLRLLNARVAISADNAAGDAQYDVIGTNADDEVTLGEAGGDLERVHALVELLAPVVRIGADETAPAIASGDGVPAGDLDARLYLRADAAQIGEAGYLAKGPESWEPILVATSSGDVAYNATGSQNIVQNITGDAAGEVGEIQAVTWTWADVASSAVQTYVLFDLGAASDTTTMQHAQGLRLKAADANVGSVNQAGGIIDLVPGSSTTSTLAGYVSVRFRVTDIPAVQIGTGAGYDPGVEPVARLGMVSAASTIFIGSLPDSTGASFSASANDRPLLAGGNAAQSDRVECARVTPNDELELGRGTSAVYAAKRIRSLEGFAFGATAGAGPTFTSGSGDPAGTDPDGSTYYRDDAGATPLSTFWVRVNGAWVGVA